MPFYGVLSLFLVQKQLYTLSGDIFDEEQCKELTARVQVRVLSLLGGTRGSAPKPPKFGASRRLRSVTHWPQLAAWRGKRKSYVATSTFTQIPSYLYKYYLTDLTVYILDFKMSNNNHDYVVICSVT